MLLDRMVNLLTRGCVVPVVKYIKQCCSKGDTDISLIRYFVTEVCTYLIFGINLVIKREILQRGYLKHWYEVLT